MIGLSGCALTSWCLILGGAGLSAGMGWLRGRPSRREVGTQHLALLGTAGLTCAMAGIALLVFICD